MKVCIYNMRVLKFDLSKKNVIYQHMQQRQKEDPKVINIAKFDCGKGSHAKFAIFACNAR